MTMPPSPDVLGICRRYLVALVLAVIGCDRSPIPPSANPDIKLHVLATVFPVADLVRQIGGQWVSVDWVVEGSRDPRDIEPSPELRRKMDQANFIVTSGYEDAWASQDLTQNSRNERLLPPDVTPAGREDARQSVGQAALWLDPEVAWQLCDAIRNKLSLLDPAHDPDYRANAGALQEELRGIIAEYQPKFAPLPQKKFLVLRPGWGALAERFGLQEMHPIDAQPAGLTEQQVRDLQKASMTAGTHVLVLDTLLPPALTRDIATRTGLRLLPLDFLGSSASVGRHTYVELLRYDLEQLEKGLRGTGNTP